MVDEIKEVEVSKKSLIEEAKEQANEIRKANKELREALEERKTLEILGGKAEAGEVPKTKDPETEARERLNAILKTTGFKI